MSKVLKSSYVSVGTPKPIVNSFKTDVKPVMEAEEAIIKEDGVDPGEAANSIIEDAKQMYLKIIEEANSEAQTILNNANIEAERLISEAKEDGYREGYEAGYIEGRNESQSIIDEASEIREFLDERKDILYKEAETEVLELVLEIARKVIGDELTQNKEAILSLINQALQKCAFKKKLVLKVSPEDFDFVTENKDRICMMIEGISDIDIISELSLVKGSCVVETPSGEVNSGIDVQIKELEKVFAYLLRNE